MGQAGEERVWVLAQTCSEFRLIPSILILYMPMGLSKNTHERYQSLSMCQTQVLTLSTLTSTPGGSLLAQDESVKKRPTWI